MRITTAILATVCFSVPAFAWSPSGVCDAKSLAMRAELEHQVRTARAGTNHYAPRPYPSTDADVIEDFKAWVLSIYGKRSAQNRGEFGVLADGLRAGSYNFDVVRVEDWTPARCSHFDGGGDTYFLLVLTDKQTGHEVARGTVHESGLGGEVTIPFVQNARPEVLASSAKADFVRRGIQARQLQYVATWGTIDCDKTLPFVAAQDAAGEIYLWTPAGIFSVAQRPRYSWRSDLRTPVQKRAFAKALGDDRYVSVGGDTVMVARRLK